MRSPSIEPPALLGRAAGLVLALLPVLAEAAPPASIADEPAEAPADVSPQADAPVDPAAGEHRGYLGPQAAPILDDPPAKPKPKKKKKKKKKKARAKKKPPEKHKVNHGTDYRLGLFPGSYVQGQAVSLGAQAGIRQTLSPRKHERLILGLDYEYEPFSTRTLGFPEEDEVQNDLNRTLVQPIHIIETDASRRTAWGKLVTTTLDLHGDAWWPSKTQHQRWAIRMTPGIRFGLATGFFGEFTTQFFYKKFPNYFIATRRIDQEGAITTGRVGYNFGKRAQLAGGFTFDFTHYLDSHYNALAPDGSFMNPDGSFIRSKSSKNYLDYIPFGELQLRPTRGLRIRGRYAFERQKTQHYDRVMTGRDEFASLTPYFFRGYYDYRRHRVSLGISWDFRDRLHLSAMAEAWVRHFDVYQARTLDNFWTGELRLDTEIEASVEAAVRVHTTQGKYRKHDFFISLLGAHVTRNSNMKHEISLATNFDITRVFLGFVVRGH